jgi:hypothetical protein
MTPSNSQNSPKLLTLGPPPPQTVVRLDLDYVEFLIDGQVIPGRRLAQSLTRSFVSWPAAFTAGIVAGILAATLLTFANQLIQLLRNVGALQ